MRWWVFAIFAYFLLSVEIGLGRGLAAFNTGLGVVTPRFVLLLAVFVGLSAPPRAALTAWGVLGLLLDLTHTWPLPQGSDMTLIGPYALGYLVGGYVLLQVRPMLFRRHPLTIASMMLICGFAAHLIVVAIFTLRAWYEPLAAWSAVEQLARRGLSLIYSALLGVILAVPLVKLAPLFAFQGSRTAPRPRSK